MKINNQFTHLKLKITNIPKKTWLFVAGVALVALVVIFVLSLRDREVVFNYGGESCVGRLTMLPELMRSSSDAYRLHAPASWQVGDLALTSTRVCAEAVSAPKERTTEEASLSFLGWSVLSSDYIIKVPSYPVANIDFSQPVAASKPLMIKLSDSDQTFNYKLSANDKSVDCQSKQSSIECSLSALDIRQGEAHEIKLTRYFKAQVVSQPAVATIETVEPLKMAETSIEAGKTVYEKPKTLTLKTTKPVEADSITAKLVRQGGDKKEVKLKAEASDKTIKLTFDEELARQASYKLDLEATAIDGSTFNDPYSLDFKTSGGPKVTATNLADGYVPGAPITVTFDQPLKDGTDLSKFVSLAGISGTLAVNNSTLTITPQAVGRCAKFTVSIKSGLVSKYDVTSDSSWNRETRARCYTVETIGYSVNGRPITAYFFGNGGNHILYTGAIHGNELSTKYTMQSWINELDARGGEIPADKTIVVVPVANPDGTAIGGRDNSRGVNLNRNFPTHNWVSDIITGGGMQAGGGGSSGGSEPETKALMNLTARINPSFVVTFHSIGALVNSNDAGNSISVGQRYASMTGYSFIPNSATTGTFGFTMTGTYEDWLLERGTPAILIELGTHYANHFSGHRDALWMTTR